MPFLALRPRQGVLLQSGPSCMTGRELPCDYREDLRSQQSWPFQSQSFAKRRGTFQEKWKFFGGMRFLQGIVLKVRSKTAVNEPWWSRVGVGKRGAGVILSALVNYTLYYTVAAVLGLPA